MLKRQGYIHVWTDYCIRPGQDFDLAIASALHESHIALLLISADFLNSDYCYSIELAEAMDRHRRGTCVVVPIIVRPCDWGTAPFSKIKVLPEDGTPISTWQSQDSAYLNIVHGIRRAIDLRVSLPSENIVATKGIETTISAEIDRTGSKSAAGQICYIAMELDGCLDALSFDKADGRERISAIRSIWASKIDAQQGRSVYYFGTRGLAVYSGASACARAISTAFSIAAAILSVKCADESELLGPKFSICTTNSTEEEDLDLVCARLDGLLGKAHGQDCIIASSAIHDVLPQSFKAKFKSIGFFYGELQYSSALRPNPKRPTIYSPPDWVYTLDHNEEELGLQAIASELVKVEWKPDLILAVLDPESPGGAIVGGKLAASLARYQGAPPQFQTIHVQTLGNVRHAASLVAADGLPKRILIVDDACFSGATFSAARQVVLDANPKADLRFAALVGNVDTPDRLETIPEGVLLARSTTASRAVFTWDRADTSGLLRNVIAMEYPDDLSFNSTFIVRPWGHMELFAVKKKAFVRILTLMPGHRLSRQKHKNRDEYFVALDDGLTIEVGFNPPTTPRRGDYIMIPRGTLHRFSNTGFEPLRCLEVAFGRVYDEEDIVRIEDDYGRIS